MGAMKRREFIALMGGTAAIWPLAARSQQQPTTPLIGFLNGRSRAETATVMEHFQKGLADAGFVEGRNVRVEYRWADGRYDRLPALATEIVDLRPTVIVATGGNVTALAAAAATSTIPIVFAAGGDPIKSGLVASLNRPGGNATGVSLFIAELASKRLEFLREIAPKATTIGILVNPGNPTGVAEARDVEARATTLGLGTKLISAGGAGDLDPAFAAASQGKIQAVFICNDPFLIDIRNQLVRIVTERALPAIYFSREFVEAGGLVSYGASIADGYRKVGVYVGQILMGARPADLPVQQPTKFELVVNLKAARVLGLEIPPTLTARADEVIE
jgi:putative tryptophan/tyrosine transport system substrate-binding protein